jgi:hypothetical protein
MGGFVLYASALLPSGESVKPPFQPWFSVLQFPNMEDKNEFDLSAFRPSKIEWEEALARANHRVQEASRETNALDYTMYVDYPAKADTD